MGIIQKKQNLEIKFVIDIFEKLNPCEYFCLYQWKWDTNFILEKIKITVKHCKIFLYFLWKFHVKPNPPPPLSKQHPPIPSPLVEPFPFHKEYFYPHPYCQIKGSQSPFFKGVGGVELCNLITTIQCQTNWRCFM